MTLQRKTLTIICLTLLGLIALLYTMSQAIVLDGFGDQEEQDVRQNVERVRSALSDNLSSLEGTARDWSLWDDTYSYVQNKNQAYFDSNLADGTGMVSNHLSVELFVDSQGHIVFQKALDYKSGKTSSMPSGVTSQIYPGSPLLNHSTPESSIKGILSLSEGPMLIASEPILPSSGSGTVKGTLIFGRFIDKQEIEHLSKTGFLDLTLQPVDTPRMPAEFARILPSLTRGPDANSSPAMPVLVQVVSSSSIAGYTLLFDVYHKPAFILKAVMNRDIYIRGQQTVGYFMIALVIAGVVFGVVTLLFLKTLILSRLQRLNSTTSSIAQSSDMSARVYFSGSDELSQLATSMNNMLSALQNSHEALEHSLIELKESEQRYRAVVEQTSEAIFLVDAETHRFLEANAPCELLLGYTQEELRGIRLDDILASDEGDLRGPWSETTDHLTSGKLSSGQLHTTSKLHPVVERTYRCKNGNLVHVEVSDNNIIYSGRDVLCFVSRDITDRKRAEVILKEQAMRDGLTGLYNRREMQRMLKEAVERYYRYGETCALILLDLDHFKSVNDTYGHQIGDDVLRSVSQLLSELVRPVDKVARYGGEELAVIMPRANAQLATEQAERLRSVISARPFEFFDARDYVAGNHRSRYGGYANDNESSDSNAEGGRNLVPITVSLGVAALSDQVESAQELVEGADQALYEAKRTGRNCTRVYDALPVRVRAI